MSYKSGQIYTEEEKAVLIRRYAESIETEKSYSCVRYFDFICYSRICSECDFSNKNMKAKYDNYITKKNGTYRKPKKKDKKYKLTLRQLRGHNG